jgi:Icc-related predicted phosphoesterase
MSKFERLRGTGQKRLTVAAASDLHGVLPVIPPCDLLLLAGDLCPDAPERAQARWLDTEVRQWLRTVPAHEVVAIAGNHDFVFQEHPQVLPPLPWHYLQDSGITVLGEKIWGTPWQPVFFDWAFNLNEPELEQKWQLIPEGTDILVVHGPPFGFGDLTVRGRRTGSPSLTRRIEEIQPKLVVCGHIHEGRGMYRLGKTLVVNVSQVDARYQPLPEIWIQDLPLANESWQEISGE